MKYLCIAPCGQRKIWLKYPDKGAQKARYVYTGPFAGKCIKYSERFYPYSWCILSAKYGFLFPDDDVPSNYNVTFKMKNPKPITVNELSIQLKEKGLDKFETIIVLGGMEYSNLIKEVFSGKELYEPLKGLKLGQRISKLNDSIRKGIPL